MRRLVAIVVGLLSTSAHADGVKVSHYEADKACPEPDEFERKLSQVRVPSTTVSVTIEASELGFVGTAVWHVDAKETRRSFRAKDCGDIHRAIYLVTRLQEREGKSAKALALEVGAEPTDSSRGQEGPTRPTQQQGPQDLGVADTGASFPAKEKHPSLRERDALALGPQISTGRIGGVAFGLSATFDLPSNLHVAVSYERDTHEVMQAANHGAGLALLAAQAFVCPVSLGQGNAQVRWCAGGELGWLRARGITDGTALTRHRPWMSIAGSAQLRVKIQGPLTSAITLGGGVPLIRDDFSLLPDARVYGAARAYALVRLSLGVTFW